MKVFFDFLPIIAFFVVFKIWGIYAATAISIAVATAHVLYLKLSKSKIPATIWVNLGLITFLGGATIIFHNEWFIKWKPTVLYGFFGSVILIAELFFNFNIIKKLSGEAIVVDDNIWKNVAISWGIFFVIMGILNILVAYKTSTEIWVNFKLFGLLGAMFVFAFAQGVYIARNVKEDPDR